MWGGDAAITANGTALCHTCCLCISNAKGEALSSRDPSRALFACNEEELNAVHCFLDKYYRTTINDPRPLMFLALR